MAPPVRTKDPFVAVGSRLVAVDDLPEGGVAEVETERHGTLAVGLSDGRPFAVSNVCRHQFGKLGRGWVAEDGCLVCPWHRARYDVESGTMRTGPRGRVFGFPPYARTVQTVANAAFKLTSHPVELRDGAIHLREG